MEVCRHCLSQFLILSSGKQQVLLQAGEINSETLVSISAVFGGETRKRLLFMSETTYVKSKELLRGGGEQSQGSNFKERLKYGKSSRGRDIKLACEN